MEKSTSIMSPSQLERIRTAMEKAFDLQDTTAAFALSKKIDALQIRKFVREVKVRKYTHEERVAL